MKYRLTIEQFDVNADYEAQMKKHREANRYQNYTDSGDPPQRERVVKVLTVEVTDVEFAAIKKAALATMA